MKLLVKFIPQAKNYYMSLILCIIYLCFRTDGKQFSFVLCLVYSSLFVMLNIMSMFDLIFSKIWKSKIIEIINKTFIAIAILVILIVYRKRFDLGNNPFDYFSIILDVFTIFTNIGFFMFRIIVDYRQKKDQQKINRYDRYSKIKIIEITENYMKKVNDSYYKLKKMLKFLKIMSS